jgi:hypothetical protein
MNLIRTVPIALGMLSTAEGHSSGASSDVPISDFLLSGVSLERSTFKGEPVLKMTMPSEAIQDPEKEQLSDRNFMAWLPLDFRDGVLEV